MGGGTQWENGTRSSGSTASPHSSSASRAAARRAAVGLVVAGLRGRRRRPGRRGTPTCRRRPPSTPGAASAPRGPSSPSRTRPPWRPGSRGWGLRRRRRSSPHRLSRRQPSVGPAGSLVGQPVGEVDARGRAAPRRRARRAARPPARAGRPTTAGRRASPRTSSRPSGPARNGPNAAPSGSSMWVPACRGGRRTRSSPRSRTRRAGSGDRGGARSSRGRSGRGATGTAGRLGTRTTSPTPTTWCRRRCAGASPPATARRDRRGAGRSARVRSIGRTLTTASAGWRGREDRDAMGDTRDYLDWHDDYEQPGSPLHRRLQIVIRMIRRAFDELPPGPIRVVSLCAGQGADLLGAADGHPRADDLTGRLVELDPRNVERRAARGSTALGLGSPGGRRGRRRRRPTPTPAPCRPTSCWRAASSATSATPTSSARSASCRRSAPPGAWVLWTRHPRDADAVRAPAGLARRGRAASRSRWRSPTTSDLRRRRRPPRRRPAAVRARPAPLHLHPLT